MGFGISAAQMGKASNTLAVGGMATSAIGAFSSASGARHQASIDETNAKLSELGAQAALLQGQAAEKASMLDTAQRKSTQRAAFASNGLVIGEGSTGRVLTSTDYLGAVDRDTIHANAVRAAWGYKTQAISYRASADAKRAINPAGAAATSLLGSGAQVAKGWYEISKNGQPATGSLASGLYPSNPPSSLWEP